jgi:hypothetical protein
MGRAYSTNGTEEKMHILLVKKPERDRPIERPRCRLVDNIKR